MTLTVSVTLHPESTKVGRLAAEILEEIATKLINAAPAQFGADRNVVIRIEKDFVENPLEPTPYPIHVEARR